MLTLHVTPQELHTILAALRVYQALIEGARHPSEWLQAIATNAGELPALDAASIDQLCQRLNLD